MRSPASSASALCSAARSLTAVSSARCTVNSSFDDARYGTLCDLMSGTTKLSHRAGSGSQNDERPYPTAPLSEQSWVSATKLAQSFLLFPLYGLDLLGFRQAPYCGL